MAKLAKDLIDRMYDSRLIVETQSMANIGKDYFNYERRDEDPYEQYRKLFKQAKPLKELTDVLTKEDIASLKNTEAKDSETFDREQRIKHRIGSMTDQRYVYESMGERERIERAIEDMLDDGNMDLIDEKLNKTGNEHGKRMTRISMNDDDHDEDVQNDEAGDKKELSEEDKDAIVSLAGILLALKKKYGFNQDLFIQSVADRISEQNGKASISWSDDRSYDLGKTISSKLNEAKGGSTVQEPRKDISQRKEVKNLNDIGRRLHMGKDLNLFTGTADYEYVKYFFFKNLGSGPNKESLILFGERDEKSLKQAVKDTYNNKFHNKPNKQKDDDKNANNDKTDNGKQVNEGDIKNAIANKMDNAAKLGIMRMNDKFDPSKVTLFKIGLVPNEKQQDDRDTAEQTKPANNPKPKLRLKRDVERDNQPANTTTPNPSVSAADVLR